MKTTLKIARMSYKQSGTSAKVNGAVPKQFPHIMAETDCDVVHCSAVGNKHWMFDSRLAVVVN